VDEIRAECDERVKYFHEKGKLIEAQRIAERTNYDMEMLTEVGFCKGIENYSRVLSGRAPGSCPTTLLDYFPEDFVLFIDESHVTLPQVRAMSGGDRSRKENLIEYGFRLPSAIDNRPLTFDEFDGKLNQIVYVSATPGQYEKDRAFILNMLLQLRSDVDELKRALRTKALPSALVSDHSEQHSASTPLALKGEFIDAEGVELCDAEEWAEETGEKINSASTTIDEMERELIRKTLEECHHHRKKAAEQLNISERTLYRKIKDYELE
jgi:DNA-binding protein Fis